MWLGILLMLQPSPLAPSLTSDVGQRIQVVCDARVDRARRTAELQWLRATPFALTDFQIAQLMALLPGNANRLTIELIQLLGAKGNAAALDTLITYSTHHRIGRMIVTYVTAIEKLETQLGVRRTMHPAIRHLVDRARARN